ncbi:hypothetical protein CPHO_03805 [Corynebacterium phocae]|uniref:RNase H type-1 domain-containing protein n=1 Tax=Corynebacterium phocae TaxID=161895 RepID=A0A1L7D256_9CORY|nr:bifunctional RNase H/acid phosphatase [Corynebacterium phocae]APT92153.1 hypothetical protein CPHO_03805 [Corynebacterium phocae]KAA8725940.1 bifunctional RNase H/acid phosphatase [Corynebacterium phocae]
MKLIIYTDGGSRGNPGISGSGTVIYAADGKTILHEIAYVVGKKATNNVAEYHGLLRGLEAALEMGAEQVVVFMDSKLVVEQVSGRWKAKHPAMQKLAAQAQAMVRQIDKFQISWVARRYNKVADALSNVAMDACARGHGVGFVGGKPDFAPAPESAAGDGAGAAGAGQEKAGAETNKARTGRAANPKQAGQAAKPEQAEGTDKAAKPSKRNDEWMGKRVDPVTMILLRHGETALNVGKKCVGSTDAELTDTGVAQAEAAATFLANRDVAAVVSSPLQRCVHTAQAVATAVGLDVEVEDDLRELDFGEWEGLTSQQAAARDPELYEQWLDDSAVECPGGESLLALGRRVRAVRGRLQKKYAGKTIVVVSHVHPIKAIVRQALDAGPASARKMHLDVASISEVEFYKGGSLVRGMNHVGHLR